MAGLAFLGGALAATGASRAGALTSELARVTSWHYQLQNIDVEQLAAQDVDLLVVDYASSRDGGAMVPLSAAEVARLKLRPDGRRRLVLAYLSIGEAENYRFYWDPKFDKVKPSWLLGARKDWPGNYRVRYWQDAWRDIMVGGPGSYLARIQDAGFDGVYLDRIDAHAEHAKSYPDARQTMMALVEDLADAARARDPDFLIVAQNGEELLDNADYRALLDGIAKEDLLFGAEKDGRRNGLEQVEWSIAQLNRLKAEGKAVLVAEYPALPAHIEMARAEIGQEGFIPLFVRRALDGPSLVPPPADPIGALALGGQLRSASTVWLNSGPSGVGMSGRHGTAAQRAFSAKQASRSAKLR